MLTLDSVTIDVPVIQKEQQHSGQCCTSFEAEPLIAGRQRQKLLSIMDAAFLAAADGDRERAQQLRHAMLSRLLCSHERFRSEMPGLWPKDEPEAETGKGCDSSHVGRLTT
jgi:hypothetical protein